MELLFFFGISYAKYCICFTMNDLPLFGHSHHHI